MSRILSLISNNINGFIIVFGVALLVALLWNGVALLNKKGRIEEALISKDSKYFKDAVTKELKEEKDENTSATPDKIRLLSTQFNEACAIHDVLVQLIPIFPLLGIMGTVAGLILQSQGGDVTAMMDGLDVALWSTLLGIIFSIILKIAEAVLPSRVINAVDIMLDDFEKKMDIAEMFQSIKEEK